MLKNKINCKNNHKEQTKITNKKL